MLQDFCEGAGDFMNNLTTAISSGQLNKKNMAFLLFSEYISSLVDGAKFKYSEETLLWWTAGYNIFGGKWLRLMRGGGEPGIPVSFACPNESTLQNVVPNSLAGTEPLRKPGIILIQ